jgi:hypothetical protein
MRQGQGQRLRRTIVSTVRGAARCGVGETPTPPRLTDSLVTFGESRRAGAALLIPQLCAATTRTQRTSRPLN